MHADRADVSWDSKKSKWVVRIEVGEEVVRRFCDLPENATQNDLRTAAQKALADEGYDTDAAINIAPAKVA